MGGDGGCRVGEVRAGTTYPMPYHKGFKHFKGEHMYNSKSFGFISHFQTSRASFPHACMPVEFEFHVVNGLSKNIRCHVRPTFSYCESLEHGMRPQVTWVVSLVIPSVYSSRGHF